AIAAGGFREDLYFRLNVIELYVPPLAERPDDLQALAAHFLAERGGGATLGADARAALQAHDWPGNVRGLQDRLHRATLVCPDGAIAPEHLGLGPTARAPTGERAAVSPPAVAARDPENVGRDVIEEALLRAKGVVSKAAAELGMSRQALYRRMERLGIV